MSEHLSKEELFLAYLDDLDESKSKKIYQHVQNCDACRQILLDYETIEKSFQSQNFLKPSPETISNIQAEARKATGSVRVKWFWYLNPMWLKAIGSTMVLILMVGFLYQYFDQKQPSLNAIKTSVTMTSSEQSASQAQEVEEEVRDDIMEEVLGYNYVDAEPEIEKNEENENGKQSQLSKKSDKMYERAQQFQNLKQYQIAMKIYYRILRKNKKYEKKDDIYFNLAYCLSEVGRFHESLRRIEKLEKLNPDYPGLIDLKIHVKKSIH